MSNPRAQKRQLEMARLERAAAKRQRRQARSAGESDATTPSGRGDGFSEDEVLAQLADLHRRYADHELTLEDFETARDELVQHLHVD